MGKEQVEAFAKTFANAETGAASIVLKPGRTWGGFYTIHESSEAHSLKSTQRGFKCHRECSGAKSTSGTISFESVNPEIVPHLRFSPHCNSNGNTRVSP